MLGTATPKPVRGSAKRQKAARKRQQAKADKAVYAAVLARDGYHCRVCRVFRKDAQKHHIVYRSQGGKTSTANVVTLCPECHLLGVHGGRIKLSGDADGALRVSVTVSSWNGKPESWAHYISEAA